MDNLIKVNRSDGTPVLAMTLVASISCSIQPGISDFESLAERTIQMKSVSIVKSKRAWFITKLRQLFISGALREMFMGEFWEVHEVFWKYLEFWKEF